MKQKKSKARKELEFKSGFKYPFNTAKRMWNILWLLLPIIGWFVLIGYQLRIIKNFIKGNFKGLPVLKFGSDLKFGFFIFLKLIPILLVYFAINYATARIPRIGWLVGLAIGIFVLPILVMNLFNKETIASSFDFSKVNMVFENLGDYIIALLKDIGLSIIFLLMFVILVGIPANSFTKNIFIADFYGRYIK